MNAVFKTMLTWLLTCLMGTMALAVLWGSESRGLSSDFGEIFAIAGVLSLASSIPGMIAYHFIALAVSRRYHHKTPRKLILSFSALLLVITSAGVVPSMLSRGSDMLELGFFALLFYGLPFVLCVFLFDYRENVTPEDEGAATDDVTGEKRVHLFLIIITILFAIPLLQSLPNTYRLVEYMTEVKTIPTADKLKLSLQVLHTLAAPVGLFLLWKRNKTGWAILFYLALSTALSISNIFKYYLDATMMLRTGMLSWWLHIIGDIIALALLNNRRVRNYLEISNPYRLITAVVSVVISLVVMFMVY